MSLDPTARESNVRDSVKKYFRDAFMRCSSELQIPVVFDALIKPPTMQGAVVSKWVSVNFGFMDRGTLSILELDIYCLSRKDSEGYRLAHLSDRLMDLLVDTTRTDSCRCIPFYQSKATEEWERIGSLYVQDVTESGQIDISDDTKAKHFSVRLRFASKI